MGSVRLRAWGATLEIVAIFSAIFLFIWRVRAIWPASWIVVLAFVALSNAVRRETPAILGLTMRGLTSGLGKVGPALLLVAALVLLGAAWLGTIRHVAFWPAAVGLAVYCAWGLLQQYIVNGFFVNRLNEIVRRPHVAPATAGILFSLLHLPNPLLISPSP